MHPLYQIAITSCNVLRRRCAPTVSAIQLEFGRRKTRLHHRLNESIRAAASGHQTGATAMTDEELIKVLYEHRDRLIATIDIEGKPFHEIGTIMLSTERDDGVERRIVLWLDPDELEDNWRPLS
jgi:hypothetical protein